MGTTSESTSVVVAGKVETCYHSLQESNKAIHVYLCSCVSSVLSAARQNRNFCQ